MKRPKRTLLEFWDQLGPKYQQLIYDVLRTHQRPGLNRGLLPFITVDEVLKLLKAEPLSPWSMALYIEEVEEDPEYHQYHPQAAQYTRYRKSLEWDRLDYKKIITILSQVKPIPTALEDQLKRWQKVE